VIATRLHPLARLLLNSNADSPLLDQEGMIAGGERVVDQILATMFTGKDFSMQNRQ
jgi:hypothetical protein